MKFAKSRGLNLHNKNLSNRQKEVIRLLQNKEVLLTDNKKKLVVTCGNGIKKVTPYLFYTLVNEGLIHHKNKKPLKYVLSKTGKTIRV